MKPMKKFYPIYIILLCSCFLFYKYILQVYPGIIANQLLNEFKLNGASLGNLAATYFYAYLATQLFAGILLDKLSIRFLCSAAILIGAIGALGFSSTHSLWQAEMYRALMGCSSAFATVCYLKNTAIWFKPNQFALVGGLLATAGMCGAIFGQAPLAILVQDYGWRQAIAVCGYLGAALAVVFFISYSQKNPQNSLTEAKQPKLKLTDLFAVFKKKQNWLLTLYSGLSFTTLSVFGGLWGNPFLRTAYHLSPTAAATAISSAFVGFAVGSPILGMVCGYFDNKIHVMLASTGLALCSLITVIYSPHLSYISLIMFMFLFGFGIGGFMLCFALGQELNSISAAATVIALINSGDGIFASFTEPLIGKILDLQAGSITSINEFSANDYRLALSLLPLYLIGAIAALLLVEIKQRKRASFIKSFTRSNLRDKPFCDKFPLPQ
jgi:MFS family permease